MVNKPLIRPYFLGGVALGGGVARIPMIIVLSFFGGVDDLDMGVSKNSGTPKWMVYKGKPY